MYKEIAANPDQAKQLLDQAKKLAASDKDVKELAVQAIVRR
jgi:hypothetical protein